MWTAKLQEKLSWKIFLCCFAALFLSSCFIVISVATILPQRLQIEHEAMQSKQVEDQLHRYEALMQNQEDVEITYKEEALEEDAVYEEAQPFLVQIELVDQGLNLEQTFSVFLQWLPLIFVISLILSLFLSLASSRYIARPVEKLEDLSLQMKNFDYRPRAWKRKDELGRLKENLEGMYQSVIDSNQQLKKQNEQLASEIEQRKNMEARQRQFFLAASHDLKTPITILRGYLYAMQDGLQDFSQKEIFLEKGVQLTGQKSDLVQSLLLISRMEAKAGLEKVDVSELVREVIIEHYSLIEVRNFELELHLQEHLWMDSNRQALKTILNNLVNNAIRYSPDRAVIRIFLGEKEERCFFQIENPNVEEIEDPQRLLEPFVRLEPSRNRQSGGNGLGLYLVSSHLQWLGYPYRLQVKEHLFSFSFELLENHTEDPL